jgi:hypothetical protein
MSLYPCLTVYVNSIRNTTIIIIIIIIIIP